MSLNWFYLSVLEEGKEEKEEEVKEEDKSEEKKKEKSEVKKEGNNKESVWVSDCCLKPTLLQFFSYIMVRTS